MISILNLFYYLWHIFYLLEYSLSFKIITCSESIIVRYYLQRIHLRLKLSDTNSHLFIKVFLSSNFSFWWRLIYWKKLTQTALRVQQEMKLNWTISIQTYSKSPCVRSKTLHGKQISSTDRENNISIYRTR